MKKLLLAVMLLATPAHANDKLPVHILGRWCCSNASTEAQEVYFRSDRGCSDATDGITISPDRYESDAPTDYPDICLFDKIKRKDMDTYVVHVHCKLAEMGDGTGGKPSFEGDEELQLINGLLFKKRGAEG
jgi:hypothetical protein